MFLDPYQPNDWPLPQTPYETEALAFCRLWLSDQASFTLHTSGSTGTPKPISLTRAQMRASAQLTGQMLSLQAGDPALVCLNVRYIAGVMMLVRGLELGLPMTILEPTNNPLASLDPNDKPVAFTALVPLQLQTILDTSVNPSSADALSILNGMKAILVGGAATSPALEKALQVINAPVYATYGMTETVSHIALRRLNGPQQSDVFTALPGVDLGTDERGCLHITSAATNFERIQTNDVVDVLDSGHFKLLGRADMVINSGGVKIQPEVVERVVQDVLASYCSAPRLFVAGLPDERLGQRLVVLIEQGLPEQSTSADEPWQAIQDAVRAQLGPYSVPKELIIAPAFAETPTGKIDRNATIARIR